MNGTDGSMSRQTSLPVDPPLTPILRGGPCVFGAIDPGLDRVSLAVFRYTIESRDRWRFAGVQDKARMFERVLHVSTSAKLSLAERLELVARGTHAMLRSAGVQRLVIEQPPGGTYQRITDTGIGTGAGSRFAAMLQTTAFATGAIMAAARTVLGDRVEFVKAQTGKKEDRLERVRMLLVSVKCREKVRNSDDLDAIGIGLGAEWIG